MNILNQNLYVVKTPLNGDLANLTSKSKYFKSMAEPLRTIGEYYLGNVKAKSQARGLFAVK